MQDEKGSTSSFSVFLRDSDVNGNPVDLESCLSYVRVIADQMLIAQLIEGRVIDYKIIVSGDVSGITGNPQYPQGDVEHRMKMLLTTEHGYKRQILIPTLNEAYLVPGTGEPLMSQWQTFMQVITGTAFPLPGFTRVVDHRDTLFTGEIDASEVWVS